MLLFRGKLMLGAQTVTCHFIVAIMLHVGALGFITAAERAGPFPESSSNACTQSYICICGCTCSFWLGRSHSPPPPPPAEPRHGPHWLWQLPAHEPAAASSLSALLLPAWLVFIAGTVASPMGFSPQTVCCCSV